MAEIDLLEGAPPPPVDPSGGTAAVDVPAEGPRPRQRRAAGRRTAHQRQHARGMGLPTATALAAAVVAVLALGVAVLLGWLPDRTTSDDAAAGDDAVATVVAQTTLLLVREAPDGAAAGLTLLAAGADGTGSATFIPSTTLVEVPGVGLDRLGQAQRYGGGGLTRATVENALGVRVDLVASADEASLGAFLQRAGGAEVTLDQRLIDRAADGTGTVAFEEGPQYLNGVRLAAYWAFVQRGETELDTLPRQQRAVEALLVALADDALRDQLLAEVPAELDTEADADALRSVLGALAEAAAGGRITYQLLPVAPFGSHDDTHGASYQLQADDVAELVATSLAGARPEASVEGPVRVQVLNGVGTPGIGQQVDAALEGTGVRITLTENARSFDFPETRIVIYEETPRMLQAAERVRQAMGVGTILVSRQPQSVVDLTIVVGADFLGQAPGSPAGI